MKEDTMLARPGTGSTADVRQTSPKPENNEPDGFKQGQSRRGRPPQIQTEAEELVYKMIMSDDTEQRPYSAASEEKPMLSPLGAVVYSQTAFAHGARRQHLEEGMMSPGTLRRKKPERTVSSNSEMSHSTRQDDDGNDGLCSLLPQLARQSSLILHGGAPNSPVVSNAEYSEQLCSLRSSVMKRSIRRNSKTIHESGTAAIATATRNLPDGLSSFAIHSDLYLAPHKLQHAIYEARRQAQLFNDTLLRKEPMLTAKKDEAPVSIDARASAHMSTYTNMWTRNEAIPRQYKDAEHIALNLLTQMTGNENGTVPRASLGERLQILEKLGNMACIKGHPLVIEAVLRCCKSKEWTERLKALEIMPAIVYKGDPTAVGMVVGRLLDWHLEVRRAAVQLLLDGEASLFISVLAGKDITQPQAVLSLERYERELLEQTSSPEKPPLQSGGSFSRASSVIQRVASGSRPASQRSGQTGLMSAVNSIIRLGSSARQRSGSDSISRTGSVAFSRVGSIAATRRPVEKPSVSLHLVCRLESPGMGEGRNTRSSAQPCSRRPKFKGNGETLRLKANDPDAETLIIELVAEVNGGGPPDETCTFYGVKALERRNEQVGQMLDETKGVQHDGNTRPSTQENELNQAFDRALSAASFARVVSARSDAADEPPRLTGPLPPSTIVLGRTKKSLTEIANQILKSEQWVQLTDGNGKLAGSVYMKLALENAKSIGCSETMGREMAKLCAPALLDADPWIRSRALRLYQMCLSAGWEKQERLQADKMDIASKQTNNISRLEGSHEDSEAIAEDRMKMDWDLTDYSDEKSDKLPFSRKPGSTPLTATVQAGDHVNVGHNGRDTERGHHRGGLMKEDYEGNVSPTTTSLREREEGESPIGSMKSPYFPGTQAMRTEENTLATPKASLKPYKPLASQEGLLDALELISQPILPDVMPVVSQDMVAQEERERQNLERKRIEEEQERELAEKELKVLIEALLGGLCDPDSGVRWTAVDLLRVVVKRENLRGNLEIGSRVLSVAVPLARLSDDEDTRVAAINAIYHAGSSCRGWTAHNIVSHIPKDLHHHDLGERHISHDHHYLHSHAREQDDEDIEGWTLRDVLEDRLDDQNWMARRAAVLAYSMLADTGDLDALHNILPLLSDENYYVKCAAMRAIEAVAGSPFLMPNTKPTELQIQIVKAILDRVLVVPTPEEDPWLHPDLEDKAQSNLGAHSADLETVKIQFASEVGVRMSLLFSLGCMEFSGWESVEHAKWSHMQEWVHDQWRQVCEQKEISKRLEAENQRALNNKYTQRILSEMQTDHDEDSDQASRNIAALHIAALERAAHHAATRMQARWRGIKGREVAREEKDAVFVRLQSAEIEKRMEEERRKAMSAIEKLREYIELSGAGRYISNSPLPGSPGTSPRRGRRRGKIILPETPDFGIHSLAALPSSQGGSFKRSRAGTPDMLYSLPSDRPRLRKHVRIIDEELVNEQNVNVSEQASNSFILPALCGMASTAQEDGEQFIKMGWDPLARKRSRSPSKKNACTLQEKLRSIEDDENEAKKRFFEWEAQERARKDQAEKMRIEKEISTRRRNLKSIRAERRPSLFETAELKHASPHKIKAAWKCGGVKIEEVVKKIYSTNERERDRAMAKNPLIGFEEVAEGPG